MPFTLDNAAIKGEKVRFYFDNLLPDSEQIRRRLQARYRTASRQPFDLLAAVGRECAGAVQLLPEGERPQNVHAIRAETLTDADIERALRNVSAPPMLGSAEEDDDFRMSIAGLQEKSAFLWHEGQWCRPLGATPTSHIFKLPLGLVGGIQADMSGSVENEWLCSRILSQYQIPIARSEIRVFGSQKTLVVERFDRRLHGTRKYWLRLVQEDFCQAFGLPHSMKYERDGGPGLVEIADVLRNSATRDADLETFFRAQVLFWMLAAGDGHAKNFSIRLAPDNTFRLTPLYDVLSYWPIIGDEPDKFQLKKVRMAMALRGKNKHYLLNEVQRRHFTATGKRIGVGPDSERLIDDIVRRTPEVIETVQRDLPKEFPQQILDSILTGLQRQAARLAAIELQPA